MTSTIAFAVSIFLVLCLLLGFSLFWRGNTKVLQDLHQRLQSQSEQLSLAVSRLERLEVEMRAVLERTRQVEPPPTAAPLGAELAPRLAAAGASVEELMRACGMTEDEAQLVARLHRRDEV